jgi:micrococcal nuclease
MSKIFFLAFFTLSQNLFAEQVTVVSCNDGDTCKVSSASGKSFKVRFWGIDAPESKQTFGASAARNLNDLIKGKKVDIDCDGKSHDRRVCKVSLNGKDIGEQLVKEGNAWDSETFSKGKYKVAQAEAKKLKKGLWYQENPVSPYCFRKPDTKACKTYK